MSDDEARKRWERLRQLLRDPKMRETFRGYAAAFPHPEHWQRLQEEIAALERGERPPIPGPLRAKHWEN